MKKETAQEDRPSKKKRPGIGYRAFKGYVRFIYCGLYNRKNYVVGQENLPEDCPLIIISDHQNGLNDALSVIFASGHRGRDKVRAIARADAFQPVTEKLFRGLGLMPAFRLKFDGARTLSNNAYSFKEAADVLLNNGTVLIYPEAGHQDKRWLGKFSFGYLRILFEAAERSNFEKEIYVMPSCNHYENYLEPQTDVAIKFGEPIALSPYYELYKTEPRKAQRQVNTLVHQRISELMLNITDLENYDAIDFLRHTYGKRFARRKGFNPNVLTEKLEADKLLFLELNEKKQEDEELVKGIYQDARRLLKDLKSMGISNDSFDKNPPFIVLLLEAIVLLALLPVCIVALIPLLLIILAPMPINRMINDVMLHSTIKVLLSALVTIPLTIIALLAIIWPITGCIWYALIPIVCLPAFFIFVVYYRKAGRKFIKQIRFCYSKGKRPLEKLGKMRENLYQRIDKLLS